MAGFVIPANVELFWEYISYRNETVNIHRWTFTTPHTIPHTHLSWHQQWNNRDVSLFQISWAQLGFWSPHTWHSQTLFGHLQIFCCTPPPVFTVSKHHPTHYPQLFLMLLQHADHPQQKQTHKQILQNNLPPYTQTNWPQQPSHYTEHAPWHLTPDTSTYSLHLTYLDTGPSFRSQHVWIGAVSPLPLLTWTTHPSTCHLSCIYVWVCVFVFFWDMWVNLFGMYGCFSLYRQWHQISCRRTTKIYVCNIFSH